MRRCSWPNRAEQVRDDGVGCRDKSSFVGDLRAATHGLPPGEYAHFHEVNAEVHRLVTDEAVLSILRTHPQAEPELLE